jgi:hypothetical protein
LPVHLQVVASADRFDAMGNAILEPLQGFLVGGFDAQRQRIGGGLDGAPAPLGVDEPVGVGPFDVLHLGRYVTAAARGRSVAAVLAHLAGVPAELDEIPARAVGLETGFGSEHDVAGFRSW